MLLRHHRLALAVLIATQPPVAHSDDAKVAVLKGNELLKQCSRESPAAAEGSWNPLPRDIERLEALLPSALAKAPRAPDLDASRLSSQWVRQYVGVIRGGRRYLYGSFFPAGMTRSIPDWRTNAVIICDGGPDVFGVEMDVDDGSISHIAFNGGP